MVSSPGVPRVESGTTQTVTSASRNSLRKLGHLNSFLFQGHLLAQLLDQSWGCFVTNRH